MFNITKNLKKGFTLIELLVVIAIIGILASIVLVSLNSARGKGRDAQRVANLQEMAKAIAIIDTDPSPFLFTTVGGSVACADASDANACLAYGPTGGPSVGALGFGGYKDPTTPGTVCAANGVAATCQYRITGDGVAIRTSNYKICTYLENGLGTTGAGLYMVGSSTGGGIVFTTQC